MSRHELAPISRHAGAHPDAAPGGALLKPDVRLKDSPGVTLWKDRHPHQSIRLDVMMLDVMAQRHSKLYKEDRRHDDMPEG